MELKRPVASLGMMAMSATIEEVRELERYLAMIARRADHHANEVNAIIFSLIGAALHYADHRGISVRTRKNKITPQLRITINRWPYVLSWSKSARKIVVKQKNQQGKRLTAFDNNDTHEVVRNFFEALKSKRPMGQLRELSELTER
jgi:hypothetical protein